MSPPKFFCRQAQFPLVLAVCLLFALKAFSADVSPDALKTLKDFAENRQTLLSSIGSFEMKGTIKKTLDVPPEIAAQLNGPKVLQYRFCVSGSGDKLKEVLDLLDETGQVIHNTTYYIDAKNFTQVDDGGQRLARMFTLGKKPNTGLFDLCPAFLQYSFLHIGVTFRGIPALLQSDVASKSKWADVLQNVKTADFDKNGALHVAVADSQNACSFDLVKPSGSDKGYQIGSVEFPHSPQIRERVQVLDFIHDNVVGNIGKSFKVCLIRKDRDPLPDVTWEFLITDIKFNHSIAADSIVFDPASVDIIYDGDNEKFITVPK